MHAAHSTAILLRQCLLTLLLATSWLPFSATSVLAADDLSSQLTWQTLPPLPNELGVAGPFVGVQGDVLLVAGGANFPLPVWEHSKQWLREVYALHKQSGQFQWQNAGSLSREIAYGASVSTAAGVVCIGGNDARATYADCFLLKWNPAKLKAEQVAWPSLPVPLAYGQACLIGETVYVTGGQTDLELTSATAQLWSLSIAGIAKTGHLPADAAWTELPACPGPPRAFNLVAKQNNGFDDCLYSLGGRRQSAANVEFLTDCWEFNPRLNAWRQRADLPRAMTAGTAVDFGQSHIFVLSGDDGALFDRTDELGDLHPGFQRVTFAYQTITDAWTSMGESPANQVTTRAVKFDGAIVLPTGEIRPRVRTPKVWRIDCRPLRGSFGGADYLVLTLYLAALLGIGYYFSRRTNNTNDYFRASGNIPWWAAGCSIFATMLSSLTFTGVPSKAFAQDWVYAMGNFMIPVVAVVAVYVALPFYRNIDATSAYEYLEQRFHRSVRIFGSACFSVFHLFRMAIVMSLTGLALAVATPLTPVQSVLIMGLLSICYCTMGGVAAVIWTDTLQTVVLLGGAMVAIYWMLSGTGDTLHDSLSTALSYKKMNIANWHLSATQAQVGLWVILVGAIGQNTASYTADQAVVQRYMTTRTRKLAARSIWTNAVLTIPTTILFFGIGTSLFLYYRTHPERLDPTVTTDQIFPLFIARELPIGVSGMIVAAIFAAAQSTVSTSMNSVATTIVTDFVRPLKMVATEHAYLRFAQALTVCLGIAGTGLGLYFVDPAIRSLFDQFIKVIGLSMGVLGGLFVLGVVFPRANTTGAWFGVLAGSCTMYCVWQFTTIHGYLYTAIGMVVCTSVGRLASMLAPPPRLAPGLTL
jgi:SSS family solute:Na+ symporter